MIMNQRSIRDFFVSAGPKNFLPLIEGGFIEFGEVCKFFKGAKVAHPRNRAERLGSNNYFPF